MPVYEFVGPDGRVVEIEGPEGSTREQAAEIFQRAWRSTPRGTPLSPPAERSMQKELAERGPFEKFMGGVGATTIESWYGLKDLFGALSDQERKELEYLKGLTGGPATAGRVTGDIGMLAAPGLAGARAGVAAGRSLPRALQARGYAPAAGALTGEAAAIAGLEAARTPGTLAERVEAARRGAVGTALGYGAGAAFTKALQGLPRSTQAQRMLDEGVPLTPGQAAPETAVGRAVRGAEARMGYLPIVGPPAQRMQLESMAKQNQALLQSTLPRVQSAEGMVITAPGRKGFREAQDFHGMIQDEFWEDAVRNTTPEGLSTLTRFLNEIAESRATEELSDEAAKRITKYLNTRVQPVVKKPNAQNLQKLNQDLRDYALGARNRGELGEAQLMEDTLAGLQGALGPNLGKELADINRGYAKLKVLEKAGSYQESLNRGGIFSPRELNLAVKAAGTPRTVASGRALMSAPARNMQETVGDLTGGTSRLARAINTGLSVPAIGTAAYLNPAVTGTVLGVGRGLVSEPVRKVLTGRAAPGDSLSQALRNLSGIAGAASAAED